MIRKHGRRRGTWPDEPPADPAWYAQLTQQQPVVVEDPYVGRHRDDQDTDTDTDRIEETTP